MIKIKYDGALVHAGGTVMQIHKNIRHLVKYNVGPVQAGEAEVYVDIVGFDKEVEFDLRYINTYSIDVIIIKLDDKGEISVERMSEISFNSRKHTQEEVNS